VFQLDQCANPNFYSFHEEFHPENSCLDWKWIFTSIYTHTLDAGGNIQEQLEDTKDNEEVAPNGAPRFGNVVNAYECSQLISKMNTEKQP